jgi:flagellar biogenesis protein FliO
LPNAQYVWWKAQFLDQELAAERATRPLFIAQVVAYAVIALGLIGLLIWKMPQIQQQFAGPVTTTQTLSLSVSLMGLVLLCLTLILGLRACWLED